VRKEDQFYVNNGNEGEEDEEEANNRMRRRQVGKFVLNDFKFLSTLGTGTFGRVRLVKHRSDPPEE